MSWLSGKRLAVVGFSPEESARLRLRIEESDAFCRVIDPSANAALQEVLRPFDASIVLLDAEDQSHPRDPDFWKGWARPVVFVGPADELSPRIALFAEAHRQFAIAPATAREVVLRLGIAIAAATPVDSGHPAAASVILADDDASITALLKATLTRQGVVCHIASNGGQALTLARELRPRAMVLDVNMPHTNGFEVLAALREDPATRDIRVIMLTGCEQESDVLRGFGLGTDDYVVKPFNPMEVAARVKRLLGIAA